MITIEQMVTREVLCCMSSLVSTLAGGSYVVIDRGGPSGTALADLCEQAGELARPIDDYEEAAIQAGWKFVKGCDPQCIDMARGNDVFYGNATETANDVAERFSRESHLEPYEWEVFEHWAVSTWFAEKLIEQGEKVDTDFAGLNVWARTTTGQGIAADGPVQRIYAAMIAA